MTLSFCFVLLLAADLLVRVWRRMLTRWCQACQACHPSQSSLGCPFAQKHAGLGLGDGVGPLHLFLSREVRLIALIRQDCWITHGFPLVNRTCALPLHFKVGNRGQREQQDGSSWAGRGRYLTQGLIKDRSLPGFHQGWSSEERNAIKRSS